jgi:hypothetical protein
METRQTAKPAHRDGGGLRDFEQLGGQLEKTHSAADSTPQAPCTDAASIALEQAGATPAPAAPRPSYATRVNAKPVAKAKTGICRECRAKFEARRSTKEFCCTACRQVFNNRKRTRGAEIYDFAMEWRDDRSDTTALTLLCRVLAKFKEEDDRAGRRSWDSATSVINAHPYLAAALLDTNIAGMRRLGKRK